MILYNQFIRNKYLTHGTELLYKNNKNWLMNDIGHLLINLNYRIHLLFVISSIQLSCSLYF